jgi:hypothetical protein
MEKPIVVEKDPLIANADTVPWYAMKAEKVMTRTTTTLSSARRTDSGNRETTLSMLTWEPLTSATPAPRKFAQMKR